MTTSYFTLKAVRVETKIKIRSDSLYKRLFNYLGQHFHLSHDLFSQLLAPQNYGTGKSFLLTSFGSGTANEVICWSPLNIIHMHTYRHQQPVLVHIIIHTYI